MIWSTALFFKCLHNAGKLYAVLQQTVPIICVWNGSSFCAHLKLTLVSFVLWLIMFCCSGPVLSTLIWSFLDAQSSNNLSFNRHVKHSTVVLLFSIVLEYYFLKPCQRDWPSTLSPWVNRLSPKSMLSFFSLHTFPFCPWKLLTSQKSTEHHLLLMVLQVEHIQVHTA